MSEMIEIVDSLEDKIGKLLENLKLQQSINQQLKDELTKSQNINKDLEVSLNQWRDKYESLKLANSMIGSNENKTEAKLKINTLIRELDECITQLSE
jgi:predicted RNase H-like nuclease (RuvC/YqgF family)